MTEYIFPPALPQISLSIVGADKKFPLRRVFCVGANYAAHAREMGRDDRQPPFFFMKPNDAILAAQTMDQTLSIPYPTKTQELHHEVELVLALGKGGKNIDVAAANDCIFGYALGLDLTRRDLQNQFKQNRQPWDMAKGFDFSAPISPILPRAQMLDIQSQSITLSVNGQIRQSGKISDMIWNPAEIIAALSSYVELMAGDIIFTGTPEGVGAIVSGDSVSASLGVLHMQAKIYLP